MVLPLLRLHHARGELEALWRDSDTVPAAGIEDCFFTMTQEERWLKRYLDVMDFMEKNHRNPSRHRLEEHDLLNWIKSNRKKMNAGELQEPRLGKFMELFVLCEKYKHKNQYE